MQHVVQITQTMTQKLQKKNVMTTVPVNMKKEKDKKFRQYNTSRFQKVANELLTIPGSESFQISESSINLSSRCSSMMIKYEASEDTYGFLIKIY